MAFNVQGSAQVPLSVFGGLVSEMAPPDLPEGVSPDCQDVVFAPGQVSSRPGLQKVFATPFSGTPTVTYGKSFVQPNGGIKNLYLDSTGALSIEDVIASPGTHSSLGTTGPGLYAKSITAFGREYIAISDGSHGQEAPLQYDGTNLDRVTQDGPGAAPVVASFALPSVVLASSGSPITLTLSESDPASPGPDGYFTTINMYTASAITALSVGLPVTIAGYGGTSAPMNGTWPIIAIYPGSPNNLIVLSAYLDPTTVYSTASATGIVPTGYLVRDNNTVTATTATAHQLQVGYQVQISGVVAAAVGGGITKIVINNEDNPGIATITTSTAHGLVPGISVSITGVTAVVVGTGISGVSWAGGVVTVTTSTAHGLSPGAVVVISGISGATGYNTVATVVNVVSTTVFTYVLNLGAAPSGTPSGGIVGLTWPIPDQQTPTLFEVLSSPTTTTFQVQVNYSDGTWTTGTVSYAWDGTFFVSAIPSTTSFQYQQYGPAVAGGTAGTATPWGQATPGLHQLQVLFLTRNGYITRPGPAVTFTAPGGQYVSVSNIPVGPPNVEARIIALTGSAGAFFYYVPAIPQVNGQVVGTSTQINDNTSQNVVLDISDNTLFSGIGISTDGNDLASQMVLDGALGFGCFAGRLITYGQRNRIQNLVNMGFDGGYLLTSPFGELLPLGWEPLSADDGAFPGSMLATGHYGMWWQIRIATTNTNCGVLSQSMYQDSYGAQIAAANDTYRLRVWLKLLSADTSVSFTATITSASKSFTSTATIAGVSMTTYGSYVEAAFNTAMLAAIPSDLTLTIYASRSAGSLNTLYVDDLSIMYAQTPYTNTVALASYVNNPEAFDGVSGVFGPNDETHQIMEAVSMGGQLYLLTLDPAGRIHRVTNNGTTEPAFWPIAQVGTNCGALSTWATTVSQADNSTGSGGEEWIAWASASGARIYDGSQPWKISQEIEPNWEAISPIYNLTTWALNDPVSRTIYFGLPISTGAQGAPTKIYTMNYRELDAAYQIATSGPVHTSFTGRLIATDHTRKWAPWNLATNGAALMYRAVGRLSVVLFNGTGTIPTQVAGSGNVYTLNPTKYTDDDYGQIYPYYTTYFFVTHDLEQSLQLGGARKILAYLTAFISGLGTVTITPLVDSISNAWSIACNRILSAAPTFDLEWAGGSVTGQRIALKISSAPSAGVVNTAGTAVTLVSGSQFNGLVNGGNITINSVVYVISTVNSGVSLTLNSTAGTQTNAVWNTGSPDNWFNLQKILVAMRKCARIPVRGSAS